MGNATETDGPQPTDEDHGLDPVNEVGQEKSSNGVSIALVAPGTEASGVVAIDTRDPAAFAAHLASPESVEEARAAMAAYDHAVAACVGPNDVIEEGGRTFKKKSAWKKLQRFFRITTHVVRGDGKWQLDYDPTMDTMVQHYTATVVVRGVAPWGEAAECLAVCSTTELRFFTRGPACPKCGGACWDNRDDRGDEDFACRDKKGCGGKIMPGEWQEDEVGALIPNRVMRAKAAHDCMATAETRASNRAVSSLIAAGEVSADEVERSQQAQGAYNPPTNRPQAGSTQRQGFDIDSEAVGKKCLGRSWRQMCHDEPGYVAWAIENMDRLDDQAKRVLRACLNGEKTSPESTDQPKESGDWVGHNTPAEPGEGQDPCDMYPPTHLDKAGEAPELSKDEAAANGDPLDTQVGFGKHAKSTWRDLVAEHPNYVRRYCIDKGRVDGRLLTALEAKLMPKPEEEEQEEKTEAPAGSEIPDLASWEDAFTAMCKQAETSPQGEHALAVMHPRYPDSFTAWTEEHYEHACRMFGKHGTLVAVTAAQKAFEDMQRDKPKPESRAAPPKLVELYESVGERAVKLGVITEDKMQAVGLLLDKASPEAVVAAGLEITRWQGLVLAHLGKRRTP